MYGLVYILLNKLQKKIKIHEEITEIGAVRAPSKSINPSFTP